MIPHFRIAVILSTTLAFLAALGHGLVHGERQRPLPRSFGPITLGMSIDSFKKIFPVDIGRCVHCVEDEVQAVIVLGRESSFPPDPEAGTLKGASLQYQPDSLRPETVTCFFYRGKLYGITFTGVKDALVSVKDRYIKALGRPVAEKDFGTGASELRWESSTTHLTVGYNTRAEGVDFLDIMYVDAKVLSQITRTHEEPGPGK